MATSLALQALRAALSEVKELQSASPKVLNSKAKRALTRVVGRSSVVLLSAHFERYIYALNEELVAYVNTTKPDSAKLPDALKLLHARGAIDDLFETQWDRRGKQLAAFVAGDAWLWQSNVTGMLEHGRLLTWMKSPKPANIKRYFNYWGISDIFGAITRTPQRRLALELKIGGLVDKRNNIAHGDLTEQATSQDVRSYIAAVLSFCDRVDRHVGRRIGRLLGSPAPW